jgi:hypothetical protein
LHSPEREKRVGIVIQDGAGKAADVEEALRVALGQTLAAGQVVVAFVGEGVWAAAAPPLSVEQGGEIEKHLGTLLELGHQLVAEAEALQAQGVPLVREGIAVASREDVLGRLDAVEVLLAL